MVKIKKLNVVKEIDKKYLPEWEKRGYVALEETVEELTVDEKALEEKTAEELTEYAKENGIDIGLATSAEGILKKIRAAQTV